MWRNQWEIEDINDRAFRYGSSLTARYAAYLARWVCVVNENSDGWPYWKAGAKAAEGLSDLLYAAVSTRTEPDEKLLKKALTPMKSLATRKGLPFSVETMPVSEGPVADAYRELTKDRDRAVRLVRYMRDLAEAGVAHPAAVAAYALALEWRDDLYSRELR